MSDLSEVKTIVEGLGKAWHDFKEKNEARIEALEKRGTGAEHQEGLEKINSKLDLLGDELAKVKARADRMPMKTDGDVAPELGEYRKGFDAYLRKGVDEGLGALAKKAMSADSDPNGGYFVPIDTSGRIVSKIYETSPMRQICSVQTIGTDTLEGRVDNDEADAGWVGERSSRTATDTPEVGQWKIEVFELHASPKATQKLLDDSATDVEAWLAGKVAAKMMRLENTAFVSGNGVLKPRGILDYATSTADDSSRSWGTVQYINNGTSAGFSATAGVGTDKILDVVYSLKAGYRNRARWLMCRQTVKAVRQLKDSDNNYIWQPGAQAGQPSMLMGYPITEAEDMPAIAADSLSIAFGDFEEAYLILDRQGIRVLRDPFTSKPEIVFYTTKRVGGGLINTEAIKLLKFGTA
jgi:HK97 family phage major capsid protein